MKVILIALSLISISSHASLIDLNSVLESNLNSAKKENSLSCPGFMLVKSCGNRICEAEKKETIENCPSDCIKTPIRSYNHQTLCNEFQTIFSPENEDEVVQAVKYANDQGLKVKVVGKLHSANKSICTKGIILSTQNFKNIHKIEKYWGDEVVVVDPGVSIHDLSKWLHKRGKSIDMTMIGFNGVSVAGSTATGSHGSSLKHPTVMASLIRSISLVNADGDVKKYNRFNTSKKKWKALRTSLGMLGIITKLRLKIVPTFNLDAQVDYMADDKILEKDGYKKLIGECDWGQINWFPRLGKLMRSCAYKTNRPADEGAELRLLKPNVGDELVPIFKQAMQLGACSKGINCTIEKIRYSTFKKNPPFVKIENGKEIASHRVVGPGHKISSSPFIPIKEGFFQMDWELAIPEPFINDALKEVKKISTKYNMCLPLIGAFIRFTKVENTTLLAHSSEGGKFKEGEDVAFIELPVYLPTGFSKEREEEYFKPYFEFVNAMLSKYHARAHWGKNAAWVFEKQVALNSYQDKMEKFQDVLGDMDPYGVFSNKYGSLIGLNWPKHKEQQDSACSSVYSPVCNGKKKLFRNKCVAIELGQKPHDLKKCNF